MSDESLIARLAIRATQACAVAVLLYPVSGWSQANSAEAQFASWLQQQLDARPAPARITAEDDGALRSKGYVKIGTVRAWMEDPTSKNDAAPLLLKAALAEAAKAGGDLVHLDKETFVIKVDVPTGKTKWRNHCLERGISTTVMCPLTDPECNPGVRDRYDPITPIGTKVVETCALWSGRELVDITKSTKCLASDFTVWRLDPGLLDREEKQRLAQEKLYRMATLESESRECQRSKVCTLSTGLTPWGMAANPATNQIYVANMLGKTLTVIDGATHAAHLVDIGRMPGLMQVDTITNKVYVSTEDRITVLDGRTYATTEVPLGAGLRGDLAVNSATNKIYSLGGDGYVTEIDGATGRTTSIAIGKGSVNLVTNPATDRIYVTNCGDDTVTVIDGATRSTTTVAVGKCPRRAAVNTETNRIYVANRDGKSLTVIDGDTNATQTVALHDVPNSLAVNSVTNKIYAIHGDSGTVSVIDGATNAVATVTVGKQPAALAVDEARNKIYVANHFSGNVTVIDGATNATSKIPAGEYPIAIVINPANNRVYVANLKSNNVTVIDAGSGVPVKADSPATAAR